MKLIDLLVKELPQRGGWPEGVTHIGQEYDRELMFYGRGNISTGLILNELAIDHRKLGKSGEKITRAQYEAALAASDGWIEWHGGECPVDSDVIIEVKYRKPNPYQYNNYNDRAGDFDWEHIGSNADIIAYRLQHPGFKSSTNDDRLEHDLNECIGQDVDVPEWNGGGLPQVGCECEWQDKNTKQWQPVKVVYSSEWVTVVREINKEKGGDLVEIAIENYGDESRRKFRPLRTEAEMAREAAETAMRTCLAGTGAGITPLAAKGIYDAIAAGKIPGVKLDK